MILFVGLAEDSELTRAVVSEQIDEIKRALDVAFCAVLDVVSHIEQLAKRRAHAAGNSLIDPVGDRHLIELCAARGVVVIKGGIARVDEIAMKRMLYLL